MALNRAQLIVGGIVGGLVVVGVVVASMLSTPKTETPTIDPKTPQILTVWTVEDDTAGFSAIITGFKNRYPEYKNAEIRLSKFPNYAEYRETLLNVLADGNSPDVFVIDSSDGSGTLISKSEAIPSEAINVDDFTKSFNRMFDPLVIESTATGANGETKKISSLMGVPLGYETLGVFYNRKLVSRVGATWAEVRTDMKASSSNGAGSGSTANATDDTNSASDTDTSSNTQSRERTDTVLAGFGLGGTYVPRAPDLLTLLLVQSGVEGVAGMGDTKALSAIKTYTEFGRGATGLTSLAEDMDTLHLDAVDLFARERVGMLIGYPSLLRPIEQAFKRAGSEWGGMSMVWSAPLPQLSDKPTSTKTNLAHYRYFVLSKQSKNAPLALAWLKYLSLRESQEAYLKAFPYMLPAMNELVQGRIDEGNIGKSGRIRYTHFLDSDTVLQPFNEGSKHDFEHIASSILSDTSLDESAIGKQISGYVNCKIRRYAMDSGTDESQSCEEVAKQ